MKKYGGALHNISGVRLAEIMRQSPYKPERYTGELYAKGGKLASNIWYEEMSKIDFSEQVPEAKGTS